MEYRLATQSPSALATHVLERDRLVIVHEKNDRREEVLFSDIRTITLQQTLGAYVLRMTRGSGRPIMIRSRYVARGGFEDRLAEYAALVTRLHAAIQAENPAIKFVGGSTQFYWLGWLLVALAVGFAALFVGALVAGHEAPPRGLLSVVALGLVGGVAAIRQGRATPYDPNAPPAKLLPR